MELAIYNGEQKLPQVEWNYLELKEWLAERCRDYTNIAYTEDDEKAMKADKATINKVINAIEARRKEIKKQYLEPYEKFEAEVKDVLVPARAAVAEIDKGLDEIDQKYREEKRRKFVAMYEEAAGDLLDFVPAEKVLREEFFKKSFTEKKLQQAVIDSIARINSDLEVLNDTDSKFKDKILIEYYRTLSLQDAFREGKRLEEFETAMKKQAEDRAKAEEAARIAREKWEAELKAKTTPAKPDPKEAAEKEEALPADRQSTERCMRITFRVTATESQFGTLNQILKELKANSVEFQVIQKEDI